MNRNVAVAIGAAIVGALAVIVYHVFFVMRVSLGCLFNPHCIPVSVIMVNGQPQIQSIGDHDVHDSGVIITWEIRTSGYTFPANGIVFPPTKQPPAPPGEFDDCRVVNNTTYRCKDNYRNKGRFAYAVTVQVSGGGTVTLDPYVVNL